MKLKTITSFTAVALPLAVSISQLAVADGGHTLFIGSAVDNPNGTVTFPLHRGTSQGQTVYFVMTDASDGNFAQQFGLNTSQKLANAAGSAGVQRVEVVNGVIDFPATIDFFACSATVTRTAGISAGLRSTRCCWSSRI